MNLFKESMDYTNKELMQPYKDITDDLNYKTLNEQSGNNLKNQFIINKNKLIGDYKIYPGHRQETSLDYERKCRLSTVITGY